MSAVLDYMRLCRLCLVRDKVHIPIFGGISDVRQIFLKISACLPVKVSQDDNLPKNICDSCLYKIDLLYQFWNTTVNSEKQLIQWLTEIGIDVNTKNTNPPPLQEKPQSHTHPHSMPETLILKQERPDPEIKMIEQAGQNFPAEAQQNMYSDYEMPYQPQVNMTVGAPTDFMQEAPAEQESKTAIQRQTQPSPAKRRGRPPKQTTPSSAAITITPAATTSTASSTVTNSKRRSSAAAAAAAVAAAAANESSDESDMDDRLGGDDSDDEDMDAAIAKEEADSEDEEYVDNPEALEPTTFVGVASGAADSEQPGPSGLSTTGKTSSLPSGNDSGLLLQTVEPVQQYRIIGYMPLTNILNPHRCKRCNQRFPNEYALKKHGRDAHDISYAAPCTVCGKIYQSKYAALQHTKRVHEKIVDKIECEICGKLVTRTNMGLHMQRNHTKEIKHKCEECDKLFYSNNDYKNHMNVVHRGVRYICFPCNKAFRGSSYLIKHRKEKHDPNYTPTENKCPRCGQTFASKQNLREHILKHDNIHNNCICDICGKVLSTPTSLRDHKMIHTGDKPFVCHVCGKAFNKKGLLAVHNLIHTKEKPHKCPTCEKCFSQRSSLKIHMRYHTGEKPYVCNICNKKFVSRNLLKMHSKVHGTALSEMNKEVKEVKIKSEAKK